MTLPVRLGNVRETPIAQIWETAPALGALRGVTMRDVCPRCGRCRYFDFCELRLGRVKAGGGIPRDVCLLAEAVGQAEAGNLNERGQKHETSDDNIDSGGRKKGLYSAGSAGI